MRVPSERFHTRSTLNSEFPPINEITMLTLLSKHDEKTTLPLFKFPAEPSCVCDMLVALSSNPHL